MPTATVAAAESLPSLAEIVNNVYRESPEGLEQLYCVFRRLGGSLRRRWNYDEYEDRLHDTFLVVVQAIRDGKLREPTALRSYILGIAQRTVCAKINVRTCHARLDDSLRHWITSHGAPTPEEEVQDKERLAIVHSLLESLNDKERQILTR